jgi:hypothetical protein
MARVYGKDAEMTAAADKIVADAFRKKGWEVLDKGWPDLLIYNKGTRKVMAIELKRGKDSMRPEQTEMAMVFGDLLGIPFHVARDADIAVMLRKKGKVVVPGETLGNLQLKAKSLEWELRVKSRELAELKDELDSATFIFETRKNGRDPAMERWLKGN